jgi:hypothetical protein
VTTLEIFNFCIFVRALDFRSRFTVGLPNPYSSPQTLKPIPLTDAIQVQFESQFCLVLEQVPEQEKRTGLTGPTGRYDVYVERLELRE